MKREDKELLLKDLSARLPYGVRGKVKADTVVPHKYDIDGFPLETTFDVDVELQRIDASNDELFVSTFDNNEDLGNYIEECQIEGTPWTIEEFTPFLRPLSSITDEELHEVQEILGKGVEIREGFILSIDSSINSFSYLELIAVFEWFNAHHFDYRGLIEKGLAIKVTVENNPYK